MISVIQSRKFNQEQIIYEIFHFWDHFWDVSQCQSNVRKMSESPNLEMNLKMAELIQFSMSEDTRNMFLDHFGQIRDDICDTGKKIHPGTNLRSKSFTFGKSMSESPILEMNLKRQ